MSERNTNLRNANLFDRPLPPGYRDEMQAQIAERPAAPLRSTGSTLLFQLGGARLALPTHVASAVAPILHIARIPHRSGTVLLGIAAFRGDILPCCSLTHLLNLPQTQVGTARTLILEESPGRRWAVPIDAVLGVRITGDPTCNGKRSHHAAQWLRGRGFSKMKPATSIYSITNFSSARLLWPRHNPR